MMAAGTCLSNVAHNAGVSDSAMSAEKAMADTMVTENCR